MISECGQISFLAPSTITQHQSFESGHRCYEPPSNVFNLSLKTSEMEFSPWAILGYSKTGTFSAIQQGRRKSHLILPLHMNDVLRNRCTKNGISQRESWRTNKMNFS